MNQLAETVILGKLIARAATEIQALPLTSTRLGASAEADLIEILGDLVNQALATRGEQCDSCGGRPMTANGKPS